MSTAAHPRLRIAATAALVCGAYLIGARLGEELRLLPVTTSVLWPPNAILTATLLLTPTRRWWIYLLAAFPAHLIVQVGVARPTFMVLALFVTNCSEALLAAGAVRRFSDGRRFDTLREAAVFVSYAVIAAPFLSSFADAAVVTLFNDEPYWLVWRTRFFANTLTELTLVPAIVMGVTRGWPWIRDAAPRRRFEAALLAVAPLVVGAIVFSEPFERLEALRDSPSTQLAFLLPVLLWAAVRFGVGGLGLALMMSTLVAVWAGAHAHGPFALLPAAASVAAFQIFLSVVGIPLLCLAAVIKERRRVQLALAERLRFEELLSRLSGAFVHLSASDIDAAIGTWLRELALFLDIDRLVVDRVSRDTDRVICAYSWIRPGAVLVPPLTTIADFPWVNAQLFAERPIAIARVEDAPPEASRDAATMRTRGIRSTLVLPLVAKGSVLGCLSFVMFTAERAWPDELVQRLRLVAEVFANALAQRDSDEAIRSSEALKSAILGSLSSGVAVLDREGRVVTVNNSWMRFAEEPAAWAAHARVGASYVESCRGAGAAGRAQASEAVELVAAVLNGSLPTFTLEYGVGERVARWFAISVVPLPGPGGGAVVAHADLTDLKRAEFEAQRIRQELAHSARVSTMGELTASLAHELNQPLAGIMTNAQAAQRFLDATPPDYSEIQPILSDIVGDAKRAAEVIDRLRELMRKGELESAPVDVNEIIRGVAKLTSSDAIIRGVTIVTDLTSEPLTVLGDRVQLQQLLLNLLLNAMEAMSDGASGERSVIVRTRPAGRAVEVFVEDTGPGLASGVENLIFEPFFTTKALGMGMGLSIARSIVQAHGGDIWAKTKATRGATFYFALPLAGITVP
jgi:signal transduction histidine kinase/integral membrane sensor domain MASE1